MLGSVPTQLVATAGADATVRLWCSTTGRQLQLLTGHGDRVCRLCWSPCGSLLASTSLDGATRVWSMGAAAASSLPASLLEPGPVFGEGGDDGRVSCLAFSPDGGQLATGASSGQVRLWSTGGEGSCLRELSRHGGLVSSVCFSPCSSLLASASGEVLKRSRHSLTVWFPFTCVCLAGFLP
ncbi:hypothetical protein CHLNCDRAFT_19120 [Chlorella variabilis]|uniref:Uncharacterized protein n=1 Tax=Chlorella variabilis TaxID=554065 RepID=E1Z3S6_CHLVA|nr:hypothetical protein CHLNCDRAFT_19120 [Chlorella variabilis]EFN59532.1 hypothetical protein CHLNCDRAFT_19120 [Chlorella variabilis]|eukprot:XP_005851634.1 hypothetical protein CHLNCDRAFT_19120 [Chlorella variabilis]